MYLQLTVPGNFPESLRPFVLLWLDDILVHAINTKAHLAAVVKLFYFCKGLKLKLRPSKCVIFARMVRWYGRILSSDGIRFDPRRIEGLVI